MELQEYRSKINDVDAQLVSLFCERMRLAAIIAAYKKEHGLPVLDETREAALLARVAQMARAEETDLSAPVLAVFERILEVSKKYQNSLMEREN